MRALIVLPVIFLAWLTGCAPQATQEAESKQQETSSNQPAPTSDAKSDVETALNKGDATAVLAAVNKLKATGKTADVVALLIRGLSNENADVREKCSQQLVDMAPDSHEAIVALMETGLQDQDPVVRKHAAEALGQIGPPAKEAVPALDQLQKNPTEQDDVRKASSLALEQINKVAESPADVQ